MTFLALTEEQKMLQEASADFIAAVLPVSAVRDLVEAHAPVAEEYTAGTAELGWFGTLISEELGGGSVSGLGIADLAVIAELRGRNLQPGPFTGSNVVASAVAAAGSPAQQEQLLPLLAAGDAHGAWVLRGPAAGSGTLGLAGIETSDGVLLDGVTARVLEAEAADWLLVTTAVDGRPRQFVVRKTTPGIELAPLETFDLTTQIAELRFTGVQLPAASELTGGVDVSRQVDEQLALAALLLVADSVGAMARLLEITIEYAQRREAFGRLIGSFQAVKHQIADASMLVHASKAVAGAATDALATAHPDAVEVVSIAKAFVSEHAFTVAQTCLQLHGGIGYAWEHDLHYYLRRLASNSALFGDAAWHRARIARLHEAELEGAS